MPFFDPGVTPTDDQLLSVGKMGAVTLSQFSPEERERYLRLQQGNPANGQAGKAWADNGAYNDLEPALQAQYADDPNRATRIEGGIQQEQQIATNGWNGAADIDQYQMGGDPAFAAQERARLLAKSDASQGRTGPVIDTSTVTPWQGGAYTAGLGQVAAGAQQGQAGNLLYKTAQGGGAGTGLEGQAGAGLMALAAAPEGPSAAEMAMRRSGDQAVQQQAAMAAGARGGNAASALRNAAVNQAGIMGNTQQQVGIQRANEVLANKNFQANAYTGAANIYGAQNNQQIQAGQAAGQAYGGAGATYGGAGQTFGTEANINAGMATNNANFQGQQMGRNDTREQAYDSAGNAITAAQTDLNVGYDKARTDAYTKSRNNYGIPTTPGSSTFDKIAGGALAVGGVAAAPFTGGASLGAVPAGVELATKKPGYVSSDIRAKKDIKPAPEAVSDAFRQAQDQASTAFAKPTMYGVQPAIYGGSQDSFPPAPGYSYEYKDPNQPGAKPGTSFGPMAQDLEKTPAGASVVGEKNGRKFVDPNRLSMLTASEVAKQRAELDALYRGLSGPDSSIRGRAPMQTSVGPNYVPNWVNDPTPIAPQVPDYKKRPQYSELSQDPWQVYMPQPGARRVAQADPGLSRVNPFYKG